MTLQAEKPMAMRLTSSLRMALSENLVFSHEGSVCNIGLPHVGSRIFLQEVDLGLWEVGVRHDVARGS